MNVTSAGWQVTLCGPVWHASSRSGEACCELLYCVYLLDFTCSYTSAQQTDSRAFSNSRAATGIRWARPPCPPPDVVQAYTNCEIPNNNKHTLCWPLSVSLTIATAGYFRACPSGKSPGGMFVPRPSMSLSKMPLSVGRIRASF